MDAAAEIGRNPVSKYQIQFRTAQLVSREVLQPSVVYPFFLPQRSLDDLLFYQVQYPQMDQVQCKCLTGNVRLGLLGGSEHASRLAHVIGALAIPWDLSRVLGGEHVHREAVHDKVPVLHLLLRSSNKWNETKKVSVPRLPVFKENSDHT